LRLDSLGNMAGGVVPDQYQPSLLARPPGHQRLKEVHRLFTVAPAVLPQEALPMGEVVRPISVHPVRQLAAVAAAPDPLAAASPGVAVVQVPVDMHLVHVDQDDLPVADAGEQLEQL